MSYRLACEAADVFVAAAGQAGTLGVDDVRTRPRRSPSSTSTAPRTRTSRSTAAAAKGSPGVAFPSPRDSIRRLAAADWCPADPATTAPTAPATIETWAPCDGGTRVEFVTVAGATHAWMGRPRRRGPAAPAPFAGYDSSAAVWSFLAAHPRR